MAGNPGRHGNGWRVRWVRDGQRQQCPVDDEQQGLRLKRWLEAQNDDVSMYDERLIAPGAIWDDFARRAVGEMTFGEYWALYNANRGATDYSKKIDDELLTIHLGHWFPLPLSSIDRAKLNALIAHLKTKPKLRKQGRASLETYAPSTIYTVLKHLSGILKAAHAGGRMAKNPFMGDATLDPPQPRINVLQVSGKKDAERLRADDELYISRTEWAKLILAAVPDPQLYLMLWVMIATGARIGEVLGLRIGSCFLDDADPFIRIELARKHDGSLGLPKAGKKRITAVPPDLAAALRAECGSRPASAMVFRTKGSRGDRGYTYQGWYSRRWVPLLERARTERELNPNLKLHPHALRFNHISWATAAGMDPLILAKSVGHQSLLTTGAYVLQGGEARQQVSAVTSEFMAGEAS